MVHKQVLRQWCNILPGWIRKWNKFTRTTTIIIIIIIITSSTKNVNVPVFRTTVVGISSAWWDFQTAVGDSDGTMSGEQTRRNMGVHVREKKKKWERRKTRIPTGPVWVGEGKPFGSARSTETISRPVHGARVNVRRDDDVGNEKGPASAKRVAVMTTRRREAVRPPPP